MNKVVVKDGKLDDALRTVKLKNIKDKSWKKIRSKQDGYMKPGERRRAAKKEGIKNSRKRERMNNRAS